jgi:hypothetical protein
MGGVMMRALLVKADGGPEVLADQRGDRCPGFLGQLLDDPQDDLAVLAPGGGAGDDKRIAGWFRR